MKRNEYLPEGLLTGTPRNSSMLRSYETIEKALIDGTILEARCVLCDSEMNLHVDLGFCTGIIPAGEGAYSESGKIKDIAVLSRVGKHICFKVSDIRGDGYGGRTVILSRRAAMRECMLAYVDGLIPGDIIPARITHLESYGAFADIGCGIVSLLPIDCMSVSRIGHPSDRFSVGQHIRAVVRTSADKNGYISLTHRELLGTWEENAARFLPGQTAAGIIRSVESYGIFVELTPNLAGLAEYREGLSPGMHAAVYIKSIIRDKMKIKLVIVDAGDPGPVRQVYDYPDIDHIDYWRYSPDSCSKVIETSF